MLFTFMNVEAAHAIGVKADLSSGSHLILDVKAIMRRPGSTMRVDPQRCSTFILSCLS
jgi:hypothetical protein